MWCKTCQHGKWDWMLIDGKCNTCGTHLVVPEEIKNETEEVQKIEMPVETVTAPPVPPVEVKKPKRKKPRKPMSEETKLKIREAIKAKKNKEISG